jgi:N-ethylmaleimide reductase
VEVHSANGYLLEEGSCATAPITADGGSLENRVRFPVEVVTAVADIWGADRVGVRLSAADSAGDIRWTAIPAYLPALRRATGQARPGLALHCVEGQNPGSNAASEFDFKSCTPPSVAATSPTTATSARWRWMRVASGHADMVAFGRPSSPIRPGGTSASGRPWAEADRNTFYGGGAEGYTSLSDLPGCLTR